jgi:hypothetical protein
VLHKSAAFKALPNADKSGVEAESKTLQRAQLLAPVPEAIPVLMEKNLTSALQVSNIPQDTLIPYVDLALEVMESYVVHAPRSRPTARRVVSYYASLSTRI